MQNKRPVRSFVLISRLLIKPQPPKNKARKGEGENGMGWRKRKGEDRHFSILQFPGYRERRQRRERLDWGEETMERDEGRATKRGAMGRGIEKNKTTSEGTRGEGVGERRGTNSIETE